MTISTKTFKEMNGNCCFFIAYCNENFFSKISKCFFKDFYLPDFVDGTVKKLILRRFFSLDSGLDKSAADS